MIADQHYDSNNPDDGSAMAPRSCTDIFCLLIFTVFLSGMGYVGHYGVKHGDPKRLTHGFNYNGSLCGVDEEVKDRPLLFYCSTKAVNGVPGDLNLKAPVCVKSCPKDDTEVVRCMQQTTVATVRTGTVNPPAQAMTLQQNIVDTKSYATTEVLGLYCIPDIDKISAIAQASGVAVPFGLREGMFNSTGPIGKNSVKVQQYFGSLRRCWPLLIGSLLVAVLLGYAYLFLLRICAKPLIYVSFLTIIFLCLATSAFFFIGEVMPRPASPQQTAAGTTAAPVIVAVTTSVFAPPPPAAETTAAPPAVVATTAAAAAVFTSATTVAPTVAVSASATVAGPVVVIPPTPVPTMPPTLPPPSTTVVARRLASEKAVEEARRLITYEEACMRAPAACQSLDKRWADFGGRKKWEDLNPFYGQEHMTLENAKTASLVTGGVFGVLGLVFLMLMCCAAKSINTACGCVNAACEAIFSMPCMLIMPAVEMAIKVILLSVLLVMLSFLLSSGDLDSKTYAKIGGQEVNGLRRTFKYSEEQQGYIAFYVFGMFWMLELANAMGAFVVSFAVVGWYYTPKPKNHNWCGLVKGYLYACTVHLGTLAFGSFFIAILRFVRLILSAVVKASEAEGNAVAACIAKILICCISCFKKFFEMINKNAYIDVCITSNNFCGAAGDVMEFLASHPAEITILNGACTIFSIAGTAVISGLTSYLTYFLCTTHERWTDEASPHHVSSPRFVAGVAFFGAVFVAHAFMVIFDHTADTLLYTYCYNKSKAHNTVQKYAPDSLANLVGYAAKTKPAPAANGKAASPTQNGGFFSSMFGGGATEKDPLITK